MNYLKKDKSNWNLEPQKSSAAQALTYVAFTGAHGKKYEIRYEDEYIFMSQVKFVRKFISAKQTAVFL